MTMILVWDMNDDDVDDADNQRRESLLDYWVFSLHLLASLY
jgi:hypothetical protein